MIIQKNTVGFFLILNNQMIHTWVELKGGVGNCKASDVIKIWRHSGCIVALHVADNQQIDVTDPEQLLRVVLQP
jgi:hypothetical protein